MKPVAPSTVVTRLGHSRLGVQPRLHLGIRELLRLHEGVDVLIVDRQQQMREHAGKVTCPGISDDAVHDPGIEGHRHVVQGVHGVVVDAAERGLRSEPRSDSAKPRELFEVAADLDTILDLTDPEELDALQIGARGLVREDLRFTQVIGEAAHENGFRAIRSHSATGVDDILAIFPENLAGSGSGSSESASGGLLAT